MAMPTCPDPAHAGSRVVRDGLYGKPGHRRQRFRCQPTGGRPAHRFTPPLTREPAQASHCSECSASLEPWAGQAGARDYSFDARVIAKTLVLLANGAPYTAASAAARAWGHRGGGSHGQLAANWVEVFANVVTYYDWETEWPEILIVDSKKFQLGRTNPAPTWHVLAAVGKVPGGEARPWLMAPSPVLNQHIWTQFFQSLSGQPRVVVSDMDNAIRRAVLDSWPGTTHYYCEFHVKQALERGLSPHLPDTHPLRTDLLERALYSEADFDAFRDAVQHTHDHVTTLPQTRRFLRSYGSDLENQIRSRQRHDPRSNGAAETLLREVGYAFPRQRASRMGNLDRTTKLFRLLTAAQRGQADETEWAVRIRLYLEARGGRNPFEQRQNDDPRFLPSLWGF